MLEEYPVIIDGETVGKATVTQEGLLRVFLVSCRAPEGLVRLSAYGEKEGYLGILIPDGQGNASLRKSFSRTALAEMPETIRYVGRAGESPAFPEEEKTPQADAPEETASDLAVPDEAEAPEIIPEPQAAPAKAQAEQKSVFPGQSPAEEPGKTDDGGILWRKSAGGALLGSCKGVRYLAVPLKTGVVPVDDQFSRQRIENTDYAVFELKNGKIISADLGNTVL